MKIMFVSPSYPKRVKEYLILPNLEMTIASSLLKEKGHNVVLVDMKIDDLSINEALERIKESNPDFLCFDDIPETHCITKQIISEIESINELCCKICLMGELPSFVPEMMLERNPRLDFCLRFDDDYALLNVVEAIQNNLELREIANIAYRENGNIVVNEKKFLSYQLDSLPMPDRNLYDISKYLARDSETIVRSSRGCPGNCLFCIKTKMQRFRVFSIRRFCDEIQELQNFGFKSFFFSDDTFAFSMDRLYEFEKELKKRNMNVTWTSNIRIKDITDEKLALMKKLGAYRVFVGIESVNEKTQQVINKKLVINEIKEKIALIKKNGLQFHASFILGNPGDTEEDLENISTFVKQIQPDIVTFNLIKVYPGLDLYSDPEKYGIVLEDKFWFEDDKWSSSVVACTKELSCEQLDKWSKKLLWEFIV